jgi:hypothetical protein
MDDCFEEVQTSLELDLHPSKLRDVAASVHEQLDDMLLMYRPGMGGVLLSYRDATILSKSAPVHTFFPYVHVKATAVLQLLKLRAAHFLSTPRRTS